MGGIGDFVGNALEGAANKTEEFIGDVTGTTAAVAGAEKAAAAQTAAAEAGITEQRRQFDIMAELMSPYVAAGTGALEGQQNILGLGGADAQQQAISGIEQSPFFQSQLAQQEDALLQNASATGGLRGGNTQAALAQFRPALLNQMVQQQFGNLGGLTGIGQASAAGQAAAGQQTGMNIANLLGQQGQAQAGAALAAGNQRAQNFGNALQIGGAIYGGGKF